VRCKRYDVAKLSNKACKDAIDKELKKRLSEHQEVEIAVQRVIDERKERITRSKTDEIRKLQKETKKLFQKKKREHDLKV
jgi:hypothetical protein